MNWEERLAKLESARFTPDVAYVTVENHRLTTLIDTDVVSSYLLLDPTREGGLMMSTKLIFTNQLVIVTGDLRPGRRGVISDAGYGRGWFSRRLPPDYLAEKFLERSYHPNKAKRDVLGMAPENEFGYTGVEITRMLKVMENEWDWMFDTSAQLYDSLSGIVPDMWDFGFGHGYSETDYSWLSAINRRFSETYEGGGDGEK